MNSFKEIISDYENGEMSVKEAAFLLVHMIIRNRNDSIPVLPIKLEEEIVDIALLRVSWSSIQAKGSLIIGKKEVSL